MLLRNDQYYHKYAKYKHKYLQLKADSNKKIDAIKTIINYNNYYLISVGDFSHGDKNIWEYRLNLLKNNIKNTDKKIVIFNEDTEEHSNNIMNTKKKLSYYKTYTVLKINFLQDR